MDIVYVSDSDYAVDLDTRRSVSGFILYILCVPVSWRSKTERKVTLSSLEAEWVALSKAVEDVRFMIRLLRSMKILVKLPMIVHMGNVGTIFMAIMLQPQVGQNMLTSGTNKSINML